MHSSPVPDPATVTIPGEPAGEVTFQDLVPSEKLRSALERLGFSTPTPVQRETLPPAFEGRDLIVQAKTGSGKTLAFGLPLLATLEKYPDTRETLAIVLTPTRELANQICEVIHSVAPDVSPVCLIGGISIGRQLKELDQDRRVVVGTPGRTLDLLRQREVSLKDCRFFAVDEVDEMFSMDFVEDVRSILSMLPQERQGLFVSATVTPKVEMLAKGFLHTPEKIIIEVPGGDLPLVDHRFCTVGGGVTAKVNALCDLIETLNPRSAIVFCNTKSDTELVEVYLRRRGFDARLLNSDLNQNQRDGIVALIKAGKLRFLIGTDIAARGLDIEFIDLVVNYAIPDQHESYVHRTGRTGRAGRSGMAISLIAPQDSPTFHMIRRHLPFQFSELTLPSESEVLTGRVSHFHSIVEELSSEQPQAKDISLAVAMLQEIGVTSEPDSALTTLLAKISRIVVEQKAALVEKTAQSSIGSSQGGDSGGRREKAPQGRGGGSSRSGGSDRGRDRGQRPERRGRDQGDRRGGGGGGRR